MPSADRIIRPKELTELLGVTKVTIWRWWRLAGTFPEPMRLSPGVTGWRSSTIERWLDEREAEAQARHERRT